DPIAVGTQLSIPFHVTHVAAATESLASIAAAYFGDAREGDTLRRYNFLERASIDKGESIAVPIFHVRVRTSKLPPVDADSLKRAPKLALSPYYDSPKIVELWKQAGGRVE